MNSSHLVATSSLMLVWLIPLMLVLAAIAVRHYYKIRQRPGFNTWPLLPAALLLGGVIWLIVPVMQKATSRTAQTDHAATPLEAVTNDQIMLLMERRCVLCHAPSPEFAGYFTAPKEIELDSEAKVLQHAERIYQTSSIMRSMPLGNMTRMTEQERRQIASWYEKLPANTAAR